MRKVLFIDRDGTLIKEPEDFQVDRIDKIRLVEDVIPALLKLQSNGFHMVMVSNQDGLGTESFPKADFTKTHEFMLDLFSSQGITFADTLICPHFDKDNCACRKPKTGLLTEYLKDSSIDWQRSAVIGDRETDIALAEAIGTTGYQLFTGGGKWTWPEIVNDLVSKPRTATVERQTKETKIFARVNLDGKGKTSIQSGIGFFDHMLDQLGRHSGIDLDLTIAGDLHIDDHHTIEDTGIALGEALRTAMSDKVGMTRYGFALPMDECRSEALIDLSGRAVTAIEIPFTAPTIGEMSTEMIVHFFDSFARAAGMNLHLTTSAGNNHHMAEASFKALARALGQAVALKDGAGLPSTKGML